MSPIKEAHREKRTDDPKEDPINVEITMFLTNYDAISRVCHDYFNTATFYKKLLLHCKHFWRVASSSD